MLIVKKFGGTSVADKERIMNVARRCIKDYQAGKFEVLSLDEYISALEACIESIPPEMVVHRLTGDGAKRFLVAPLWSADKKTVLNAINRAFERDHVMQGARLMTT